MKRVSSEVAKALKEAGYPQEVKEDEYSCSEWDSESKTFVLLPYAMDIWLWLWREKKIVIEPVYCKEGWTVLTHGVQGFFNDPEEAIIGAIEYLGDNDLIK